MKKIILLLSLVSCSAFSNVSTGDKQLPKVVADNMFCVGYTQAIYENTTLNTSVNTEAEAAMQFFYSRDEKLQKEYHIDDGAPDSGGGTDTDALNREYSLGYATYLRFRQPMPDGCLKVYSKAVQNMSTEELLEPYNK